MPILSQPEGKAADYYRILERNPRPGYLFERFRDAWLEQHDLAELETFLAEEEMDLLLAFHYEAGGEPQRAVEVYGRLLEARPDWPQVLFYSASAHARLGHYPIAGKQVEKLLAQEPDAELRRKALALLGRCQVRAGRTEEGVQTWERMLADEGLDSGVADDLLDLLLAEGLHEKALELCNRMLAGTTDAFRGVELRMRKAIILVRLDRRDDAVACLREAFGKAGQGSWLRRDLLARIDRLYRGADNLDGLRMCLAEMRKVWPRSQQLQQRYAETLAATGKDAEALETARALVAAMPGEREVREWYAGFLLNLGETQEAIRLMVEFLDRFPDDNDLRLRMAALDEAKRTHWIWQYLEHSAARESDYLRAARELKRFGLDNEATSVYMEMLARWPESFDGREAVALHLARQGGVQLKLAMKHYEWLAVRCDLETLVRLSKTLLAVNDAPAAAHLLALRTDDFANEYRFAAARYEAAFAAGELDQALELGWVRVDLAQAPAELERSVAELLYLLKMEKKTKAWSERLENEQGRGIGRTWLLASLYLDAGEPGQADALLIGNPALRPCRLMLARHTRNLELLEQLLLELVEDDPASKSKWLRELVDVLHRAGKTGEALEWIAVWKGVSPNSTRPYELERDVLLEANRPDEAVAALRRAVARFDDSKELRRGLGLLYEKTGRAREAEQLYWRMLNAEEELRERLSLLADLIRVAQAGDRLDLLVEELERRSEKSGEALFPLLGLVECHRADRNVAARSEALERVLELRPNDLRVLREKARLEEELGNHAAARDLMLRIAQSDAPGDALRKVAEYELLFGDEQQAARLLDDPRLETADVVALAETLLEKGCLPLLTGFLREQATADADFDLLYLYALSLEEGGQPARAVEAFGRVLALADADSGNELERVLDSMRAGDAAYAYRQNGRLGPSGGWKPRDVPTAKRYALAHLGQLLAALPQGQRKAPPVPYGRLLLIDARWPLSSPEWWNEALRLYPDSDELALKRLSIAPQTLESEAAVRAALAHVPEGEPGVALDVLMRFLEKYPALIDQLPGVAGRMMQRTADLEKLAKAVGRRAMPRDPLREVPPGLAALVAPILEKAEATEGFPPGALHQLRMQQALLDGDYAAVAELLRQRFDREVDPKPVPPRTTASTRFPPDGLFDADALILQGLAGEVFFRDGLMEALRGRDDARLYCALALAHLNAPEEEVAARMEAIGAQAAPTDDERFALVCWHAERKPEQALRLMLELAEADAASGHRAWVEAMLLALAAPMDPVPENLKPELCGQLERMKPATHLGQKERFQLLALAERLGLPVESFFPAPGAAVAARPARTVHRVPDPYQQVRELIQKKQTAAALELVAGMLRKEAQSHLFSPQAAAPSSHHLVNSVREIQRNKLGPELLGGLAPKDDAPHPRRVFEHAFSCEMLGERDRALASYQRLYALRPEWRGATVRYVHLLALADPEAAAKVVAGFSPRMLAALVGMLQATLQDRSVTHEQRLALCGLVAKGLVDTPAPARNEFSNASMQLQQAVAANDWHEHRRGSLPGLFSVQEKGAFAEGWQPPDDFAQDAALAAIQQRRRELYLDMCKTMARIDALRLEGFTQLMRYLDHVGLAPDPGELLPLAEHILREGKGTAWSYSRGSGRGRTVSPMTFYLLEQRRAGRLDAVEALLGELAESNIYRDALAALLRIQAMEDGPDYAAAVGETLASRNWGYGFHEALLKLHDMDGRTTDLDAVFWERVRGWNGNYGASARSSAIAAWIDAKQEEADPQATVGFVQRLLEVSFSQSERELLGSVAEGGIGRQTHPSAYAKYQQVVQVLNQVGYRPDTVPGLVDLLAGYDHSIQEGRAAADLFRSHSSEAVRDAWLEQFGLFADWADYPFRTLPNARQPMLDLVLIRLRGAAGTASRERLMALETPTFGEGVLRVLLDTRSTSERPSRMLDYLEGQAETIVADPARHNDLFRWFDALVRASRSSVDPAGGGDVLALYNRWKVEHGLRRCERLLALDAADALANWNHWKQEWGEVVKALSATHPEELLAMSVHLAHVQRLEALAGGRAMDGAQVLRSMFGQASYTEAEARLAERMVDALADDPARAWLREYRRMLSYRMFERVERRLRAEGADQRTARFGACCEILAVLLDGHGTALEGVQSCVARIDRNDFPKLAAWLAEAQLPESDMKRLLETYLAGREGDAAWVKAYLSDESKPPGERLQAYSWLVGTGADKLAVLDEPELVLGLLELGGDGPTDPIPGNAYLTLVHHVRGMEPVKDRLALAQRLFVLWKGGKVNLSGADANSLRLLAGLAAEVGLVEEAVAFLSTPELAESPQTYAVALRHGLDAFVAEQLPRKLLGLENAYRAAEVWINKEAAGRREAIAAQVADPELRLLVELFIAVLPVKAGQNKYLVDHKTLVPLLKRAAEELTKPEHVEWVATTMEHNRIKQGLEPINRLYAETMSVSTVLRKNDRAMSNIYLRYLGELAAETNLVRLGELADQLVGNVGADDVRHAHRKSVCNALVKYTVESGDQALMETGMAIGFGLWAQERAAGWVGDRQSCYWFVGKAASMGMKDPAAALLAVPELLACPETYAVALRAGLDAFVADRLPDHLLALENNYAPQRVWIPQEAAERREAIALPVDDAAMRLLVELFVAILPTRTEGDRFLVDAETLEPLLARAACELTDPEQIRWVVNTFIYGATKEAVPEFDQFFTRKMPADVVLHVSTGHLLDAYGRYVDELAASRDYARLSEIVDRLNGGISAADLESPGSRRFCDRLVRYALYSGNDSLVPKGIGLGMQVEGLANPDQEPKRGDVLRKHGWVEFDPSVYGLDLVDDSERLDAFDRFDVEIMKTIQHRFTLLGLDPDKAPDRSRGQRAILADWIERAGRTGFAPLRKTLYMFLWNYGTTQEELAAHSAWLDGQGGESLMQDQVKAILAMVRLQKGGGEEQALLSDVSRYLGRPDLDVAEKVRVCVKITSDLSSKQRKALVPVVLGALAESDALAMSHGYTVLPSAPVPPGLEDYPLYQRIANGRFRRLALLEDEEKRDKDTRESALLLLETLFALGRTDDALGLMNDEGFQLYLEPKAFALALENGQVEWCEQRVEELVLSYAPPGGHRELVPDSPAVQRLIDSVDDPDIQLAARVLFWELARKTSSRDKMVFDGVDPVGHVFSNPLCGIQVRRLLESRGMADPTDPDPCTAAWIASVNLDELPQLVEKFTLLEREAFERFVYGLFEGGQMARVCAMYERLAAETFDVPTADWLVDLPVTRNGTYCYSMYRGRAIKAPARFKDVDVESWKVLLEAMDRIHRNSESRRWLSNDVARAAFCISALLEDPKFLESLKINRVSRPALLFPAFTLYSGAHWDYANYAKMERALSGYVSALQAAKARGGTNEPGRQPWPEVAADVLNYFPYSKNKTHWSRFLVETFPDLFPSLVQGGTAGKKVSDGVFLKALREGELEWCKEYVEGFVVSFSPLSGRRPAVEESPALLELAESVSDPALRLAARLMFWEMARRSSSKDRLDVDIEALGEMEFADPLCAVQVYHVLENRGLVGAAELERYACAWVDDTGLDAVLGRIKDLSSLEFVAFETYINALLDSGRIGEVCAIYEKLCKQTYWANLANRLVELPSLRTEALRFQLSKGQPVTAPGRFNPVDIERWFELLKLTDRLHATSTPDKWDSNVVGAPYLVASILSGRPGEFRKFHRRGVGRASTTFPVFTLFAGLQDGDADPEKMKDVLEQFCAALTRYKASGEINTLNHMKWSSVTSAVLATYPYSEDREKWFEVLAGIVPEPLDREALLKPR
ncbi:hypothetical protein PDESU_04463 [Pontiella desulfatans]|uniref:Beta-barrel assembly-enhancing protease n=1 Tax=Pontiella desulfatans TaxID=2750659 RepID=A0A6C2U7H5_PONDE|nr:tetratricopeptide repeat protein [Pontiella desulfatans]VGO15875.1 hypothetical protein PDESU_04463 [Pontiella desulfatans]